MGVSQSTQDILTKYSFGICKIYGTANNWTPALVLEATLSLIMVLKNDLFFAGSLEDQCI